MHLAYPFGRPACRQRWDIVASLAARAALASALALLGASPSLAQQALISHAEQPSRLIRKSTVYVAPAGVRLQAGDIVEADSRPLQIEWPDGTRLALGPASSVLLNAAGAMPSASLLRGWGKFTSSAPPGGLALDAGALSLRAASASASAIVRLAPDKTELFVEHGVVAATDNGTPGARSVSVGRDQYAAGTVLRPIEVAPRAPRLFVGQMPRSFYDPLVKATLRVGAVTPTPQRDIAATDIAAWRDAGSATRARLARQFAGRLADARFRNEAEDVLAPWPEWREALRRQLAVRNRANRAQNYLF